MGLKTGHTTQVETEGVRTEGWSSGCLCLVTGLHPELLREQRAGVSGVPSDQSHPQVWTMTPGAWPVGDRDDKAQRLGRKCSFPVASVVAVPRDPVAGEADTGRCCQASGLLAPWGGVSCSEMTCPVHCTSCLPPGGTSFLRLKLSRGRELLMMIWTILINRGM